MMVIKIIGIVNDWKDIKKIAFCNIENLVTNFYVYAQEDESPKTLVEACVKQKVKTLFSLI